MNKNILAKVESRKSYLLTNESGYETLCELILHGEVASPLNVSSMQVCKTVNKLVSEEETLFSRVNLQPKLVTNAISKINQNFNFNDFGKKNDR